jgi:hypothetical protein
MQIIPPFPNNPERFGKLLDAGGGKAEMNEKCKTAIGK